MAACAACNTTILFGGVREGNDRYCNADCHSRGYLLTIARQIPQDVIREHTNAVYRGMCPVCHGPGPVEVHRSYRIWSALILTSWRTVPRISCRRCALKAQAGGATLSLLFGWWGFPWGFIMTPIQIGRNVAAMFRNSSEQNAPSAELEQAIGMTLASQFAQRQ